MFLINIWSLNIDGIKRSNIYWIFFSLLLVFTYYVGIICILIIKMCYVICEKLDLAKNYINIFKYYSDQNKIFSISL